MLSDMLEKSFIVKCISVSIIFISIISGAVSIFLQPTEKYSLFSKNDIFLSSWIKDNTPSHAVFLTAPVHNSFVSLAGRRILTGNHGQLWSHGIDFSSRANEITLAYAGVNTSSFLEKYGISYIVIGPNEMSSFKINKTYFREKYITAKEYEGTTIFGIK